MSGRGNLAEVTRMLSEAGRTDVSGIIRKELKRYNTRSRRR